MSNGDSKKVEKGKKGEVKKEREKQSEKSTRKCNPSTNDWRVGISDFETSQQIHVLKIHSTKNKISLAMDWLFCPTPAQFTWWSPNVTGFGMQGLWEVTRSWGCPPHNEWGECPLKRERGSPFSGWGHCQRSAVCKPGRGPHQNPTRWHPDLRLLASRTVRNTYLLKSPSLRHSLQQPQVKVTGK